MRGYKYIFFYVFSIIGFVQLVPAQNSIPVKDGIKTFWIVNSLHGAKSGGLSAYVQEALLSKDAPVQIEVAYSPAWGQGLENHWNNTDAVDKIREGNYDIVVLQGYGDDSDDKDTFFEYVRKFDEEIKATGAQSVLFMRWANNPDETSWDWHNRQTEMLIANYDEIGAEIGAPVVPLAEIWHSLLADPPHPSITPAYLFEDNIHQSDQAKGINTYAFFSYLTHESPIGLDFQFAGYVSDPEIDPLFEQRVCEIIQSRENWLNCGGSQCNMSLSETSHNFTADAGNTTITVTTDETYSVSDDQDWITISKDGDQVTITVTENSGSSSRNGTITVSGCSKKTITIRQEGKGGTGNPGSCATGEASFLQLAGEVVIEAENFNGNDQKNDGAQWSTGSSENGFSGAGYVYMEEGVANNDNGTISDNAQLTYNIEFTDAGTYTIWVRRWAPDGGGNSVFALLGGMQSSSNDNTGDNKMWVWKSLGTVTASAPGVYVFELIRREDGYLVDKIVVNSGEQPSGEGPDETNCVATSISKQVFENFRVYPNPTSHHLNFTTAVSGTVYNLLGEKLLQFDNARKIDVLHLDKGTYLLKLENGKVYRFLII